MNQSTTSHTEPTTVNPRVVVLGGGRWGLTLASLAAQSDYSENEVSVFITSRSEHGLHERLNYFQQTGRTRLFCDPVHDYVEGKAKPLSERLGLKLPAGVNLVGTYEEIGACIENADLVIVALKSETYRPVILKLQKHFKPNPVIASATKSLFHNEKTGELRYWSDILWDDLDSPEVAIISGPNLSNEIIAGKVACTLVASRSSRAQNLISSVLKAPNFSVRTTSDVKGTQLLGLLKNTYAMAAGVLTAREAGRNALGAFVVKVQTEATHLLERAEADYPYESATGLAGIGDMLATMFSPQSRNATVGRLLAEGWRGKELFDELARLGKGDAEGLRTNVQLLQLARRLGAAVPVVEIMQRSLQGAPYTFEKLVAHLLTDHGKPAYVVSRGLPPRTNKPGSKPARTPFFAQPHPTDVVYHRAPRQPKLHIDGDNARVEFELHTSPNGIMTALTSAWSSLAPGSRWIAALPYSPEQADAVKNVDRTHQGPWAADGSTITVELVPMPQKAYDAFYGKFAKNLFWPVLHDYPEQITAEFHIEKLKKDKELMKEVWEDYRRANDIFAEAVCRLHPPESSPIILVEDYNAWLVPGQIKKHRPHARIAFFHHTYLPPAATFRKHVPESWLREICQSLSWCDSVGVHTPAYAKGLIDLFQQLLPEVTWSNVISAYSEDPHEGEERQLGPARYRPGSRLHDVRNVPTSFSRGAHSGHVVINPVTVSPERYEELLKTEPAREELKKVSESIGNDLVIFSTARADYTKGLLELVKAFHTLKIRLRENSELLGRTEKNVRLVLGAVKPNLEQKPAYRPFVESLDRAVEELKLEFPDSISYHESGFKHHEWAPYARKARVVVFAPGHDGLNTMGQEAERFIAAQVEAPPHEESEHLRWWEVDYPVIITSPHCGACAQLPGALIADPAGDINEYTDVLLSALQIDLQERRERSEQNRRILGPTPRWLGRNLNNLHTVTAAAVRAFTRRRGWRSSESRWEADWSDLARSQGVPFTAIMQALENTPLAPSSEREALRDILRTIPLNGPHYDLDVELFTNQTIIHWAAALLEEHLERDEWLKLLPEDCFARSPREHDAIERIAWGLGYNPDVREAFLAKTVSQAFMRWMEDSGRKRPGKCRADLRFLLEETVTETQTEEALNEQERLWIERRLLSHQGPFAIFLDFDGVCAEFTRRADQTELSPHRQAILSQLVLLSQVDVGLISARPLKELQDVVDVDGLMLSGNHGREAQGFNLSPEVKSQVKLMRQQVADACELLLKHYSSDVIQNRGLTFAVRLREIPKSTWGSTLTHVKTLLRDLPIVWKEASSEIEGHPQGEPDSEPISKATAVEAMLEKTYQKRAIEWQSWNPGASMEEALMWSRENLTVICAGDDYGDIPMLESVQRIAGSQALPIHVVLDDNDPRLSTSSHSGKTFPSVSDCRLRSPRQMFALLQNLVEHLYEQKSI